MDVNDKELNFEPVSPNLKLLYLDQNVLSDLRNRKIEKSTNNSFYLLKNILHCEDIVPVYSEPTLVEIDQIKSEAFKNEHIELLGDLNAEYIISRDEVDNNIFINKDISPKVIWQNHLMMKQKNIENGLYEYEVVSDLQGRKHFGLITFPTYQNLYNRLKDNLATFLKNINKDRGELADRMVKNYLELMDSIRSSIGQDNKILIDVETFRRKNKEKIAEIVKLRLDQIIPAIKEFSPDYYFDYYKNEKLNKVCEGYRLLNLIGYFSDDFLRVNKRGDRYAASYNDSYHVMYALGMDYLISNDVRFQNKAKVCYAYAKVQTCVLSVEELLSYTTIRVNKKLTYPVLINGKINPLVDGIIQINRKIKL